jgi:DNA-binding CsgD family transcriptional regulator
MNHPAMRTHIRQIESAPYHEEKLVLALRGFIDLFPFQGASLFNYSALSRTGEGILSANEHGLFPIREERQDIRNMPPILSAIRERRAQFVDAERIRQLPAQYVRGLTYVLIVPIFHGSAVLGYASIAGHADGAASIGTRLLDSLSLYGEQVGKALATDCGEAHTPRLTKREVEVLQRMSWGESIKEMAERIGISEFTIQDYIKSALRKLEAQNRAQGVAEALRRRIIT